MRCASAREASSTATGITTLSRCPLSRSARESRSIQDAEMRREDQVSSGHLRLGPPPQHDHALLLLPVSFSLFTSLISTGCCSLPFVHYASLIGVQGLTFIGNPFDSLPLSVLVNTAALELKKKGNSFFNLFMTLF